MIYFYLFLKLIYIWSVPAGFVKSHLESDLGKI